MLVFFIILSLIFNVISLLAICILFLRQNKLLHVEKNQKKAIEEMEVLINTYLLEMKDENKHFIHRVKEMQKGKLDDPVSDVLSTYHQNLDFDLVAIEKLKSGEIEPDKKEMIENDYLDLSSKLEKTVSLHAAKAYQQYTKQKSALDSAELENKEKRKSIIEMKQALTQAEKQKSKQADVLIQDSLLTQVMIMKKEGLTENEMAQRLKKGKTEIELLLKFRENQQE